MAKKVNVAGEAKLSDTAKKLEMIVNAPNFKIATFKIEGGSEGPLVINAFSKKAREQMRLTQEEGSLKGSGKKVQPPKDFEAAYQGARHISTEGWDGIPAGAFRAALISACRTVGVHMTRAKLVFFIVKDGIDKEDGTPLVRVHGTQHMDTRPVRLDNGAADLRARPMWNEWHAFLRIRFDEDMMSLEAVSNLLVRAGLQVGICEGRPDSKASAGCGWGTFNVQRKPVGTKLV